MNECFSTSSSITAFLGIPKGTQITHEGFFNYINWCLKSYPVNDGNGSVFHSTLAFDATITSIFPSLVVGKTVVVLPDKSDIDELAKALVKFKDFSTIKITPAHLELLSNQIKEDEASSITRSFIIGGENLTSGQINFWQKNAPDTLLFNEYGPTETVVGCIVYEASKWKGNGSVPIGKVIPNLKIYVLDRFLNPVAKGIPGELYIGGKGLARCYLGLPDLTAEKFIPDPFCSQEGERIYKTGDIVKILHDGNLIFLNRIDDQVKIRGYRIELGEIQKICNDHQDINESIFILKENTPGVKMLIGYIISKDQKLMSTLT